MMTKMDNSQRPERGGGFRNIIDFLLVPHAARNRALDVSAIPPATAPGTVHTQSRRRWFAQIVVLVLALALITGMATSAAVRVRRKEQDGPIDWQVRPLAIAHRGDDSAPENSLHAITNAGANGADYAEIDVRLDADGTPVVFHDRSTGRLAADGRNVSVGILSTRELQHLTMRQNGEDFHVPTLEQAVMAAQHVNDHLGLLLDMKTGSVHAPKLTRAISRVIERNNFSDRAMFMSTNDDAVEFMRKLHPGWTVGKCVSPAGHPEVGWPRGVSFVVMRGNRLDQAVLDRANRSNIPVYAGVSGDYNEGRRCLKLGADGVLGASAKSVRRLARRFAFTVRQGRPGDMAASRASDGPHDDAIARLQRNRPMAGH
ncbi:glycerophosphodiester phosphodiesterase family protein [Bifidobacterium miconisargentati]|uniref:glycerophosphodiester phosphodiesterase family protein n=1 Tax=Bifidobacterium miconisargentati TaxID=2834437 RepID=UPI001BDD8E38|nr:glycerophosphodiester phosphodiesterase family protein [Bifidobacterium miconisargentati]MBW3090736.1 hypothetical protein [Bifidobacterium miconisargentati]